MFYYNITFRYKTLTFMNKIKIIIILYTLNVVIAILRHIFGNKLHVIIYELFEYMRINAFGFFFFRKKNDIYILFILQYFIIYIAIKRDVILTCF